jgi:uncharacterized membrane protein
MKTAVTPEGRRRRWQHAAHEAEGIASGAMLGAVRGVAAGPPGIVAGVLIGAMAGGVTILGLDREADRGEAHMRELDAEIGVSGGDMGAPNLRHPLTSAGSSGA